MANRRESRNVTEQPEQSTMEGEARVSSAWAERRCWLAIFEANSKKCRLRLPETKRCSSLDHSWALFYTWNSERRYWSWLQAQAPKCYQLLVLDYETVGKISLLNSVNWPVFTFSLVSRHYTHFGFSKRMLCKRHDFGPALPLYYRSKKRWSSKLTTATNIYWVHKGNLLCLL
jgi:hypothetical protein